LGGATLAGGVIALMQFAVTAMWIGLL
jgi:hypothetical protein